MELDEIPELVQDVKRVHASLKERGGKWPKKRWTKITSAIKIPANGLDMHVCLTLKYLITIKEDGRFSVLLTKEGAKKVEPYISPLDYE